MTAYTPPQYAPVPEHVNPLDLPYPGANPVLAVKRFFQNYAKFSGRASRSEYWWVQLAGVVVYIVLGVGGLWLGTITGTRDYSGEVQPGPAFLPFAFLLLILGAASIVPNIAVTVRRLHDANFPGLLYLIILVPYLGSFALLILNALPPKPEGAQYDRFRSASAPAYTQPYGQSYGQAAPLTPPAPSAPPAPPAPPVV